MKERPLLEKNQQQFNIAWLVFFAIASALTLLAVWLNIPNPFRAIIVFSYLFFIPGWSFVRLLQIGSPIAEWTIAVALSLALNTLVAMLLLYAQAWSYQTGLLLVLVISLAGSLFRPQKKLVVELPEEEPVLGGDPERSPIHKQTGGPEI